MKAKTRSMKRLLMLTAFVGLMFTSCKGLEVISVKYESLTMMGKTEYTITKDSVIMNFTGRKDPVHTARATSSSEWEALTAAIENITLEEIKDLEAPTNKRATDASPFGRVYITTKDTTYVSQSFDGFVPHEELQPLLDEVKKIVEKK